MPATDNDFSQETVLSLPILAADAKNWDLVSGSGNTYQLVTGNTQPVELAPGNGGGWLAYLINPTSPNVSLELKIFVSASGIPSTARMGVFCRLADISNYIALVFDCNTQEISLFQVIAGTTTVLFSGTTTSDSTSEGVSIKLELIGRRARYWFNPRFYRVDDAPPDGAVDLLTDANFDDPGEWGIYAESNSSGTKFRACHFYARELPNVSLPPPGIRLGNASNLSFKAITGVVSDVDPNAVWIEWEIAPADPDDFAEVYRDFSIPAMTTRTFWGRPGYMYDVRARSIDVFGVISDWTPAQRVNMTGTKIGPTAPTFPDDVFPDVIPDYVLEHQQVASSSATVSGTNRERLISDQIRPRRQWTLKFENRQRSDIAQVQQHFDNMQGMTKPWIFQHPSSGELIPARFANDELDISIDDEGDESPVMSCQIDIIEAIVGVVPTLAPVFELDDSF